MISKRVALAVSMTVIFCFSNTCIAGGLHLRMIDAIDSRSDHPHQAARDKRTMQRAGTRGVGGSNTVYDKIEDMNVIESFKTQTTGPPAADAEFGYTNTGRAITRIVRNNSDYSSSFTIQPFQESSAPVGYIRMAMVGAITVIAVAVTIALSGYGAYELILEDPPYVETIHHDSDLVEKRLYGDVEDIVDLFGVIPFLNFKNMWVKFAVSGGKAITTKALKKALGEIGIDPYAKYYITLYESRDDPTSRAPFMYVVADHEEYRSPKDDGIMIKIPAGEFLMGSSGGDSAGKPVHKVYLDAYYIDTHEVTNAQFSRFLNEKGNRREGGVTWLDVRDFSDCLVEYRNGRYQPKSGYENHPVMEVSWYGARAYAEWAGKRLPTEAEWEKAARGGLVGEKYPWGDEDPEDKCLSADYRGPFTSKMADLHNGRGTLPVGSFLPNGYGLYDMAGNVLEWCSDWYDAHYYSVSPYRNPEGPRNASYIGPFRVTRDGSWNDAGKYLRCGLRQGDDPGNRYDSLGFRCAKSVEEPKSVPRLLVLVTFDGTRTSVRMDGVRVGIAGQTRISSNGLVALDVPPGTYTYSATKPGYLAVEGKVDVSETEKSSYDICLYPSSGEFASGFESRALSSPRRTGEIAVVTFDATDSSTRMDGVSVTIAGQKKMSSNGIAEFVGLEPTGYEMTASKSGYETKTGVLCTSAGSRFSFDIHLNPPSAETRVTTAEGELQPSTPIRGIAEQGEAEEVAGMVLIGAGEFLMGSDDGHDDERPMHKIYLDPYYIDTHEVTNARFSEFLNDRDNQAEGGVTWLDIDGDGCLIEHKSGRYQPESGRGDHPVVRVTWYGARAYAEWAGKRLPTEAEWEKAARGGLVGEKYPWGDTIDSSKANYGRNVGHTTPVGSYPSNGYGIYDIAGNVWEWCSDWYDKEYYSGSPGENPQGPDTGSMRVVRGGGWYLPANFMRLADRRVGNPGKGLVNVGFRCAKSVSGQETEARKARPWIGIYLQELTPELSEWFEVEKGVLVAEVVKGSPAEKVGIEAGDVVKKVNGKTVESALDLRGEILKVEIGQEITLSLIRKGGEMVVTFATGKEEEEEVPGKTRVHAALSPNNPPVITNLTATPKTIKTGDTTTIICIATDPDRDSLSYAWSANGGSLQGEGKKITYKAPGETGIYVVKVEVSDNNGGVDTREIAISVRKQTGTLKITSHPSQADISMNGAYRGKTPLTLSNVEVGTHRIRAVKGEETKEETVRVRAKETALLEFSFVPPPPGMVLIPAGEFLMGSEDGGWDEKPVHKVYLDNYYIDKYEVTNAQFSDFLNEKGNQREGQGTPWLAITLNRERCLIEYKSGRYQPKSGYENHPVIFVSWYGARAYAKWAGKRLPTEAEWEKAARGGLVGKKYPWGDSIDSDKAKYGRGYFAPVGSYPPNGYGLYDMAGNVDEWVSDWYDEDYYSVSPYRNPQGPTSGSTRVWSGGAVAQRGGGVASSAGDLRCASRDYGSRASVGNTVGFRCAKDAQ